MKWLTMVSAALTLGACTVLVPVDGISDLRDPPKYKPDRILITADKPLLVTQFTGTVPVPSDRWQTGSILSQANLDLTTPVAVTGSSSNSTSITSQSATTSLATLNASATPVLRDSTSTGTYEIDVNATYPQKAPHADKRCQVSSPHQDINCFLVGFSFPASSLRSSSFQVEAFMLGASQNDYVPSNALPVSRYMLRQLTDFVTNGSDGIGEWVYHPSHARVYFTSFTGSSGAGGLSGLAQKLLSTDGKDIQIESDHDLTSTGTDNVSRLTVAGDRLFYTATSNDDVFQKDVSGETRQVSSVTPALARDLVAAGSRVYYVARSSINDASGQPSRQHYTSDGTTNERLTTTTAPFGGGNSLVLAGSRVYFVSGQGASGGSAFETGGDLFSINRTSYQVSANVNGSIGIDDSAMILGASSSRLFFSTRTSGVPTIASTDGTSVVRYTTVNDVRSSTGRGLQTPQLTSVGGRSYFVGASGLTGSGLTYSYRVNLFSVDETSGTDIRQHTANTTTMVDANTRAFYRMATVGSSLFFSMSSLGAANSKLFEVHSSGTGVRQVASLNGSSADEIRWLTTLGSKVFFRALVGGRSKLFSYDGTELVQITDLVPDGNDEPCGLTAAMGRIFFWAYTGFETSKLARLFSTDGTDLIQHTLLNSSIDDVSMSGCSTEVGPGMLAVGNDFLLFTARDGSTSRMKLFSICSADNPNCGAN